ncbi:MAG TPA: serine hydrolase [Allosphingosinicella sp.]|jgi:CubicO group peptidase (beta-lactamase class C family)
MINSTRRLGAAATAALALAAASPAAATVPADFKARADAVLAEAYPADGPGVAVVVMDDGKIVYSAGRGLADIEAKTPISPDTLFRMGSITKQFSAATLLQLVDEGKVSLSDPLSKFLPGFPKPAADATVAQLLNHTAGVQPYTGIPGWMVEENTSRARTTEEMIALFRDLPVLSKPGEQWMYNNSGYVLVGAVIEKVTGKPWYEAVAERIARPLGLATIRYGVGAETDPGMAVGYTIRDGAPAPAQKIHMSVPHAAGALVGTVGDLAKWAQALHHGKVVRAGTYAQMIAPTRLPDGRTEPYGFGLGLSKIRKRGVIGHSGGIFGFTTDSAYLPQEDMFVAVFANSDAPATNPGVVMQRLAGLALGDPFPSFHKAAFDVKALEPLFGVYPVTGGGERQFYARDGHLYLRRSGEPEMEAFAAGGNRYFFGPGSLAWFATARDASGKPAIEMHPDGGEEAERSVRAGPIPPEPAAFPVPAAILETYVGRYDTPMGPLDVAIDGKRGLRATLGGQPPVSLRATSLTDFQVREIDAVVAFRSEGGAVAGLVIRQGGQEIPAARAKAKP